MAIAMFLGFSDDPFYSFKTNLLTLLLGFFFLVFFAILFLQSGLDKVNDRKGNLDWLKGHFANSPLKNVVPFLLTVLTILELLVGTMAVVSICTYPIDSMAASFISFITAAIACITLLALFFGQRMAKDYAGAAGIVPYLIVSGLALIFFGAS